MSDFRLSAVLELRDNLSGRLRNATRGMQSMSSSAGATSSAIDRASSSMDRGARSASTLQRNLSGLRGSYSPTINVQDNASSRISRVRQELNGVQGAHNASLGLRDMASSRISQIRGELQNLTGRAYTATVNVVQNGMAQGGPGSKLMNGVSGVASGMMMSTGVQMMGAAGIGYGIFDTVNTYKEFEKQMAAVKSISTADMGAEEAAAAMDRLTKKAREMGAATQFSATEAGKAFEYMGMAGWNVEQMISGIPSVLNLALASGEDLASVSDIVTDAMTALKIDTRGADADKNIRHFTDVLAAAATHSNTNVGMMGEAFKYAAAPAGLLTHSYENAADVSNDVALALGLMANSGIKASQAGTALRSTLTRMTADTIPTANAMKMLGVDITQVGKDGTEQLKPLRSIFDDLRKKMKEGVSAESLVDYAEALSGTKTRNKEALMSFAEKLASQGGKLSDKDQAKFAKMFAGEEALSGWLAVMTATDEDYQSLIDAIDNSGQGAGAAAKMAGIRADTLAGDFDVLKSAWEDLQIEFMQGPAADGLREFLQGLQKDVNKFKDYIKDGFDISDVGKITLDVLNQLKDKFLEMDGIGSVLAGGVLIGALYKLGSKAKSVADTIKNLATSPFGNSGVPGAQGGRPGLPGGLPEVPSVNSMVVNARSVVVNGNVQGGGSGGPEIGDIDLSSDSSEQGNRRRGRRGRRVNRGSRGVDMGGASPTGSTPSGRPPRAGSGSAGAGKWMGRLGVPLAVAMGAWDIYSTSKENDALAAEAQKQVDKANSIFDVEYEKATGGGMNGLMASQIVDNKDLQSAFLAQREALANQEAVKNENLDRMGESVGSTGGALAGGILGAKAGAAVGGGIGAFFGGAGAAPGAAIGGLVGGIGGAIAGSELGGAIGSQLSSIKEAASQTWEAVKAEADNTAQWIANSFSNEAEYVGNSLGGIKDAAQNEWDYVTNSAGEMASSIGEKISSVKDAAQNEWNYVASIAGEAVQGVKDKWGEISSWADSNLLTPVKDAGITAINFVVGAGVIIGGAIGEALSPVVSYLDENVWTPIKDTALNAWQACMQTCAEVAEGVKNTFSDTASWFDANVWQPVKDFASTTWDAITSSISEKWESAETAFAEASAWFDTTVWQPIRESAATAWDEIGNLPALAIETMSALWDAAASYLDTVVWQPISFAASAAWDTVTATAGAAWEGISPLWGVAASWFDATVWQPVSSAVDSVKSAIVGAFESAWSAVKGIWSAAAGWFESNVIGPVKAAFDKIVSIGSGITGLTTSGGVPGHASGTSWTAGGWTEVNEHGGEIIDLPTGARVYPHATTVSMLKDTIKDFFGGISASAGSGLDAASIFGALQDGWQGLMANMPSPEAILPSINPLQVMQEIMAPAPAMQPATQSAGGRGNITINIESMNVREEEDIDRIAYKLQQLLAEAADNYNFVEEGV